ncbi:hypothetical protein HDU97_008917 [Phlyctochytrium planicorne]|nr:hypothetical protein HDU97_008917 [Phlyctochytrium planicorne]
MSRAEYFVLGYALHEAGIALNFGRPGQLVVSVAAVSVMETIPELEGLCLEDSKDEAGKITIGGQNILETSAALWLMQECKSLASATQGEGYIPRLEAFSPDLLPFLESSLSRHVSACIQANPENLASCTFVEYNQLRPITVVFIQDKHVQKTIEPVTRNYVEDTFGPSQKRWELQAVQLRRKISFGIAGVGDGRDKRKPFQLEYIAQNMPSRFAGVIGTECRSEGTVLGPCVNLAARIMCHPLCSQTVMCDHETMQACKDQYEFEAPLSLTLKGMNDDTRVYVPLKRKLEDVQSPQLDHHDLGLVEGRKTELAELIVVFERWLAGKRGLILVTGKSGIGKTQLLKTAMGNVSKSDQIMLCMAVARENRRESNFVFEQIIDAIYTQCQSRGWTTEKMREYTSGYDGEDAVNLQKDATIRLCNTLIKIFSTVGKLGFKLAFLIDDAQWMDSESFDTVIEVINRCPAVLVTITSRPREEYTKEMAQRIRKVETLQFGTKITLGNLQLEAVEAIVKNELKPTMGDLTTVSPRLVSELYDKSQGEFQPLRMDGNLEFEGNPMVVKLLCRHLQNDPDIAIRNGVLRRNNNSSAMESSLPADATVAIVSQLDRLSPVVRGFLRIASVAEVKFVLSSLSEHSADYSNPKELESIISTSVNQGILNLTDSSTISDESTFSFAHYLIHQGIYHNQLPGRREEIHGILATFYENHYIAKQDVPSLSALLYHLLKVPNQEQRKLGYVRCAFAYYADRYRSVEGFRYFTILEQLKGTIHESRTPFQISQELRQLTQLHSENGDPLSATETLVSAFRAIGYEFHRMSTNAVKLQLALILYLQKVTTNISKAKHIRFKRAFKFVKKRFKKAFDGLEYKDFKRFFRNGQIVPELAIEDTKMKRLHDISEEFRRLLKIGAFLFWSDGKSGNELALVQCLEFFFICLLPEDDPAAIGSQYSALASVYVCLGFPGIADKLLKKGEDLVVPRKDELSKKWNYAYFCLGKSVRYDSGGDWQLSGAYARLYITTLADIGITGMSETHIQRLVELAMHDLSGEVAFAVDVLRTDIVDVYGDNDELVETAEVQLQLASFLAHQGKWEVANSLYEKTRNRVDDYFGTATENGWRTLLMSNALIRIELYNFVVSRQPEVIFEWMEKLQTSLDLVIHGLKILDRFQYLFAFPLFLMIIPPLLDLAYLCLQNDFILVRSGPPRNSEGQGLLRSCLNVIELIERTTANTFPSMPKNTSFIRLVKGLLYHFCYGDIVRGVLDFRSLLTRCLKFNFITPAYLTRLYVRKFQFASMLRAEERARLPIPKTLMTASMVGVNLVKSELLSDYHALTQCANM